MQSGHSAVNHTLTHIFNAPLERAHIKHLSEPTWVQAYYVATFFLSQIADSSSSQKDQGLA